MRKMLAVVTIAGLLAVPGVAAAGGGGGGPCPPFAEGQVLGMEDNCFAGVAHFAAEGSKLTIRNAGRWPHTFTSVDGLFDTGTLAAGESYELKGLEAGAYRVFCTLHGTAEGHGMAGVLIVGDDADAPAGAAVRTRMPAPGAESTDADLAAALADQAAALANLGGRGDRDVLSIGLAGLALVVGLAAMGLAVRRRSPGPVT